MKNKKQSAFEATRINGKFLTRHQSTQDFSFFGCCSDSYVKDIELGRKSEKQPQKISIKNGMKKSAVFRAHEHSQINQSQYYSPSRKTVTQGPYRQPYSRKPSQLSDINLSDYSQTPSSLTPRKVNFIYKQVQDTQKVDNSVHNYHTTNYIFEKYIVQPQQMNIFMKDREQQKHMPNHIDLNEENDKIRNFDLSDSFNEEDKLKELESPKWNSNAFQFKPDTIIRPIQPKTQQQTLNNFSFGGAHQRKMFMNKYGFIMREAQSNRPSRNSQDDSQPRDSIQSETLKQDQFLRKKQQGQGLFLRGTFKKHGLNAMVRDADVFYEQAEPQISDSECSQVIDDYKSIMSRIETEKNNCRFQDYSN